MRLIQGWDSLLHTILAAAVAYTTLIAFLRISGKRTLAKMNAFDLVVTVALGSTLATIVTSDRLPLANGVLAMALLISLQYVVAWTNLRLPWFRRLVKSDPTLLFYRGAWLGDALLRSRVTRDEVLSAVRGAGVLRLTDVSAVVLEPDGSFSVITGEPNGIESSSLQDVEAASGSRAAPPAGQGRR